MRSLFFLVLYVIVVVSFAKVYQVFCAGDFYAPYAHLEASWKAEESKGNKAIETAIIRSVNDYQDQRRPIAADDLEILQSNDQNKRQALHLIKILKVGINEFHMEGRIFTFSITFEAPTENRPPTYKVEDHKFIPDLPEFKGYQVYSGRLVTSEPLIAPPRFPSSYSTIVPGGPVYLRLTESIDPTPSVSNPFFRSLVPYEGNATERKLFLDPDETQILTDIIDEYSGVSVRIGQNFGRMLYLSVVISSTLGLGDIVPLSPLARFLVGLEVFLGIIVAGAFINSVPFKR